MVSHFSTTESTKVHVGFLPTEVTEEDLERVMAPYGPVRSVRIIRRPLPRSSEGGPEDSDRINCHAFVQLSDSEGASRCIAELHSREVYFPSAQQKATITVRLAESKINHNARGPRQQFAAQQPQQPQQPMGGFRGGLSRFPSVPQSQFLGAQQQQIRPPQQLATAPGGAFPRRDQNLPPDPTRKPAQNWAKPRQGRMAVNAIPAGKAAPHTQNEVKLFVGNLPQSIHRRHLVNLLAPYGELLEVFIFRRVAVTGARCAFVRFGDKNAAHRAIEELNGYALGNLRLVVREAAPEKGGGFRSEDTESCGLTHSDEGSAHEEGAAEDRSISPGERRFSICSTELPHEEVMRTTGGEGGRKLQEAAPQNHIGPRYDYPNPPAEAADYANAPYSGYDQQNYQYSGYPPAGYSPYPDAYGNYGAGYMYPPCAAGCTECQNAPYPNQYAYGYQYPAAYSYPYGQMPVDPLASPDQQQGYDLSADGRGYFQHCPYSFQSPLQGKAFFDAEAAGSEQGSDATE